MDRSPIGQKIARRIREERTAEKFFGEFVDLSAGLDEDDYSPVNLRIGEFYGIEMIPGCDPISALEKNLIKKYGRTDAVRIIEAANIVTGQMRGLDCQLRMWEELKRALETEEVSAGKRRYAGVRGSRAILKELTAHLNGNNNGHDKDISTDHIQLISGGSTAALHFLIDMFETVAYGYPGYLYDIHSGFNGKAVGFQAWDIDSLVGKIMDERERLGIKAAIINVPHNPLGYNLTESSVKSLNELSENVKLIFDNVYGQYDKKSMELLSQVRNKIILRSFSKEFGMPGIRLAYAIFDNPEEREMIQTSSSAAYVSIANPVLQLAKWALQLNRKYGLSKHIVEQMKKRQAEFERAINGQISSFGVVPGSIEGMYRILYLDKEMAERHPEVYSSGNFVGLCAENGVIVTPLEIFTPPDAAGKLEKTGIRIAVSGSPRAYEGGKRVLAAAENMYNRTRE